MIEMMRRDRAAARAILDMKTRLIATGLRIKLSSKEHAMVAAEFEGWARTERDPKKAAELASLGRLARMLCKVAEEGEAKALKRTARKRRDPKRSPCDARRYTSSSTTWCTALPRLPDVTPGDNQ